MCLAIYSSLLNFVKLAITLLLIVVILANWQINDPILQQVSNLLIIVNCKLCYFLKGRLLEQTGLLVLLKICIGYSVL